MPEHQSPKSRASDRVVRNYRVVATSLPAQKSSRPQTEEPNKAK